MAPSTDHIFRFLDLPPELRNQVYHFAFSIQTSKEIDLLKACNHTANDSFTIASGHIRRECLQIYNESQQIFWRNNKFTIEIGLTKEAFADQMYEILRACTMLKDRPIQYLVFNLRNIRLDVVSDPNQELHVDRCVRQSAEAEYHKTDGTVRLGWLECMKRVAQREHIRMESREWDGCPDVLSVCKCVCGSLGSSYRFW